MLIAITVNVKLLVNLELPKLVRERLIIGQS